MSSQLPAESGKSIFISYRREDSQDVTGRIYDRLIQKFNPESIFKDVDAVPMGVDFRKHLEQEVAGCRILLVIVGRRWADNRRLQDKGDFVRIEIEYGLDEDRGILVVPVLVGNADMPSINQLPASLKDFAFRNAIHVRPDPDFHRDMDKLVKSLIDIVGKDFGKQRRVTEIEAPTHKPYKIRGRKFYEPKELAIYLSENWAEGVEHLRGEYISVWVKAQYQDQGLAIFLDDITSKDDLTADQKLSLTLLVLNEDIPLLWKGDAVNREWLAANPEIAIEICGNDFPQLYEKYRPKDDVNLRQIAGQIQQVMADEAIKGKLKKLQDEMLEAGKAEYLLRVEWDLLYGTDPKTKVERERLWKEKLGPNPDGKLVAQEYEAFSRKQKKASVEAEKARHLLEALEGKVETERLQKVEAKQKT